MKTSIIITGSGIQSKLTLLNACSTYNSVEKGLLHGNYELIFPTKKEAVKALSDAYQTLHSDLEDWNNSAASYAREASLSYDAGSARIDTTY